MSEDRRGRLGRVFIDMSRYDDLCDCERCRTVAGKATATVGPTGLPPAGLSTTSSSVALYRWMRNESDWKKEVEGE